MRVVLIVLGALVIADFFLAGTLQALAHQRTGTLAVISSPNGKRNVRIAWHMRLPFGLSGRGRAPGEVQVTMNDGTVVDEEDVEDVLSVRDVTWSRSSVSFTYAQEGKVYASTLALEP